MVRSAIPQRRHPNALAIALPLKRIREGLTNFVGRFCRFVAGQPPPFEFPRMMRVPLRVSSPVLPPRGPAAAGHVCFHSNSLKMLNVGKSHLKVHGARHGWIPRKRPLPRRLKLLHGRAIVLAPHDRGHLATPINSKPNNLVLEMMVRDPRNTWATRLPTGTRAVHARRSWRVLGGQPRVQRQSAIIPVAHFIPRYKMVRIQKGCRHAREQAHERDPARPAVPRCLAHGLFRPQSPLSSPPCPPSLQNPSSVTTVMNDRPRSAISQAAHPHARILDVRPGRTGRRGQSFPLNSFPRNCA